MSKGTGGRGVGSGKRLLALSYLARFGVVGMIPSHIVSSLIDTAKMAALQKPMGDFTETMFIFYTVYGKNITFGIFDITSQLAYFLFLVKVKENQGYPFACCASFYEGKGCENHSHQFHFPASPPRGMYH